MSQLDRTYLQVNPPFDRFAFHGFAASLQFLRKEIRDELPESYEELWQEKDGNVIAWLEVPDIESAFVCFFGTSKEQYLKPLKQLLLGNSVEDLLSTAPKLPHDDLLLRFFWIAYMIEKVDQRVLDFFDSGLTDTRINIRLATLNAYMIRRWPEWRYRVELASTADPEVTVRDLAKQILEL
jgi:hypothetical protein